MKRYNKINKSRQQGVALAIGIILLLIIAVIGVNSMKSALLQEKMAGGFANLAAAETASYSIMVAVENHLSVVSQNNNGINGENCDICEANPMEDLRPTDPTVQGLYRYFKSKKDLLNGHTFNSGTIPAITTALNLAGPPVYLVYYIESKGTVSIIVGGAGSENEIKTDEFLIIAKSTDPKGNIFVVSEALYSTTVN